MSDVFIVVRAVHFGSAMLLFGELLFALAVAGWASRAVEAAPLARGGLDRHVHVAAAWSIAASTLSGACWLAMQAAAMAGTAIDANAAVLVLRETAFGRVWSLRGVSLVILAIALAATVRAGTAPQRSRRLAIATVLAAVYLASIAWAGHAAAAMEGETRALHVASDAAHLLAAGAWMGALPPLVWCLRNVASQPALERVTQRFSRLGIASVLVLAASGIVNAYFLVGSFPALFGTVYGRLLCAKLAVFIAMLALAVVNRTVLTPRLAREDPPARHALRRNTIFEIASGVIVIAIVGALGATVPAAHQSPEWPFPFAFASSLDALTQRDRLALYAAAGIAFVGIVILVTGLRRQAMRAGVAGVAASLVAVAVATRTLAVPAFPTTFATSPVPYSVGAVMHGALRYASACSGCHGAYSDGATTAPGTGKPVDLAAHASRASEGNLFWWIAHGMPGTAMPAFSPPLEDTAVWELVQFVVALSEATKAESIGERAQPFAGVRMPDFAYEIPGRGQEVLSRTHAPVLLVLCTPRSLPRVAALASDHRLLHADLRVIAAPLASAGSHALVLPPIAAGPDVGSVYAMFARSTAPSPLVHAELLIDATGLLRARWTGVPAPDDDRTAAIIAESERLAMLPSSASPTKHRPH